MNQNQYSRIQIQFLILYANAIIAAIAATLIVLNETNPYYLPWIAFFVGLGGIVYAAYRIITILYRPESKTI